MRSVIIHIPYNIMADETINFYNIPIFALSIRIISIIAKHLNEKSILPTKDNIHRDYRGLQEYSNVHNKEINSSKDPTATIIKIWGKQNVTFGDLILILELMDRYHIVDEIDCFLRKFFLFLKKKTSGN